MQGFYFAKAMHPDEVPGFVAGFESGQGPPVLVRNSG
jgi:hypothetical protein